MNTGRREKASWYIITELQCLIFCRKRNSNSKVIINSLIMIIFDKIGVLLPVMVLDCIMLEFNVTSIFSPLIRYVKLMQTVKKMLPNFRNKNNRGIISAV